jgi:1-deoxy-D-xylulose-5-phosphate reductoisomerase
LARYQPEAPDTLEAVLAVDEKARAVARARVEDCVV